MSKKFLVSIILATSIIIVGFFVWLLLPQKYISPNFSIPTPPQDIKQQNITSEPKVETKPQVHVSTLRHTLPDGSYEIIASSTGDYFPSAVIWNDWLFFTQLESVMVQGKTEFNMQVVAYNFKTNEKKIIFDAEKNGYGFLSEDVRYSEGILFNSVWIINNDLYFQFGGDKAVHIVWAKLPSDGDFKELINGDNRNIFTISNTYWLQSGFGDACVSHSQIRYFDPLSKKVGPEISFADDCGGGNEFISQRGENLIVQEFHVLSTTDYSEKSAIDNIYLLNFKNLSKRPLLGSAKLPAEADPYGIYYNQPADLLLLLSNSNAYTYNFKTDVLKKIASGLSNYYFSEWTDKNQACLILRNNSSYSDYAILDIITGKAGLSAEKCDQKSTESEYHYSGAEYLHPQNLSTVKLPANFEFITE